MLSAQELQRFRERGDVGDLLRAEHAARISVAVLPHGNPAGDVALASALTALHRFREADAAVSDALGPIRAIRAFGCSTRRSHSSLVTTHARDSNVRPVRTHRPGDRGFA